MESICRTFTSCVFALSLILVFYPAQAALNDPCGCNAGLVPELVQYSSSSRVRLAFIQQIDERQYEKIKKGGSASADFLDIIKGSASYSEFNEKRSDYLKKNNFLFDTEQSQSLLFSTVRTSDWAACKRQCIRSQQGFICDIADFTEMNIAVSCSWRPEGPANKRRVDVRADGKQLPPETIDPNTTRDWQFPRNPSRDLLMTFTPEGGSSQTLKIAATPKQPPSPPIRPVKLGSCIGRGGLDGVHFWGPEGKICNNIPAWGLYQSITSETNTRICSCIGHGGPEGVRLWGPEGKPCGGITAWGTYHEQCVSSERLSICSCFGHGNILEGHFLWGPKNEACGGMPNDAWGKYSQYCAEPQ